MDLNKWVQGMKKMDFKYFFIIVFCLVTGITIYLLYNGLLLTISIDKEPTRAEVVPHTERFKEYLKNFSKSYNETEFFKRLQYFKISLDTISVLNNMSGNDTLYGLNKFADMSREEFEGITNKALALTTAPLKKECNPYIKNCINDYSGYEELVNDSDTPLKFDWRTKEVIGPVLDQKRCMACWAFSAIGVVESMAAMKRKPFTRLSIQEMIDVASEDDNHCDPGDPVDAVNYFCNYKIPITTESNYPLTLRNEPKSNLSSTGWLISWMRVVCDMDTNSIIKTIARHGPVVALVNSFPLKHYLDGIIRWHCDDTLNHVVQIIGYDNSTDGIPHFIVKNSWGEDYGIEGYAKIAIGNFICGLGRRILYLDVKYSDDINNPPVQSAP